MREVDVPIVDPTVCENLLKQTRLGAAFILNRNSFMCAGGEPGKDACTVIIKDLYINGIVDANIYFDEIYRATVAHRWFARVPTISGKSWVWLRGALDAPIQGYPESTPTCSTSYRG